jgi:hypothetical protein
MTRNFAAVRCVCFGLAASALGAALFGAPAQAAQTQAASQAAADTAATPADNESGHFPLPSGVVGFGWG